MGTVSLAVISVKTTFYICKNVITNERYTICMYHLAYHVASHCIALYFICLYVLYICESNSVELQINVFIIIITFLQTCEEFYVCVTHLLGVYCDGVFLYLHVVANFVYVGSLLFKCM